jgi:hypothetical protein
MTKFEATVVEEITVETAERQEFELSLAELDMVAGGTMGCSNL